MPSLLSTTSLAALTMPLYERIRIDIQSRMIQQGWAPDEPIPTESVLALEYNVSVGTIRKAIERLVQDGLLLKIQGKGTFIKRPDFKNSLLRFFRYRNALGQFVVPSSEIQSLQQVPAIPYINQQLGLDADTPLIQIERLRMVDTTVVLSESIWLSQPLFAPLLDIELHLFKNLLYPFYYETCQQFVLSANESLSFTNDHTDNDLAANVGDLLIKIERVAHNIEGLPIEYRVSYGHPQNFRYEVRIS